MSAAIAIGTGGPFGAEGPIIATGSALGSVFGQVISTTAAERKTLLAAGAAAGMAATFGTPVAAVLLAIELLLFEYRPRSIIPVALAASAATGIRILFEGMEPMFPMGNLAPPTEAALVAYVALGAFMGLAAVVVTRVLYAIEDGFERLPIHWMWWPALGGLAVGVIGWIEPNTLGIGYRNIQNFLAGNGATSAILLLCATQVRIVGGLAGQRHQRRNDGARVYGGGRTGRCDWRRREPTGARCGHRRTDCSAGRHGFAFRRRGAGNARLRSFRV